MRLSKFENLKFTNPGKTFKVRESLRTNRSNKPHHFALDQWEKIIFSWRPFNTLIQKKELSIISKYKTSQNWPSCSSDQPGSKGNLFYQKWPHPFLLFPFWWWWLLSSMFSQRCPEPGKAFFCKDFLFLSKLPLPLFSCFLPSGADVKPWEVEDGALGKTEHVTIGSDDWKVALSVRSTELRSKHPNWNTFVPLEMRKQLVAGYNYYFMIKVAGDNSECLYAQVWQQPYGQLSTIATEAHPCGKLNEWSDNIANGISKIWKNVLRNFSEF